MMEWQLNLKVGKATVHVEFKGGFENEYGIHPATFITKDPIVQNILERSSYFACGKIVLLDSKDLGLSAAEITAKKRKADAAAKKLAEQKAAEAKQIAEQEANKLQNANAIAQDPGNVPEDETEVIEEESDLQPTDEETSEENEVTDEVDEDEAEQEAASEEGDVPENGECQVMTVTCNEDAKQYLIENCGGQSSKLRSRDQIIAFGQANGILFEFK